MPISSLSASKRLCAQSGWSISNLKLQKLLYIAHMFHLGHYSQPLIDGYFEAWDYGPVEPEVYHKVKVFGTEPIGNIFSSIPNPDEGSETQLLDEAVAKLGKAAAGSLVNITHWKEGAWASVYTPGARGIRIPDKEIIAEFKKRERHAAERRSAAPVGG